MNVYLQQFFLKNNLIVIRSKQGNLFYYHLEFPLYFSKLLCSSHIFEKILLICINHSKNSDLEKMKMCWIYG